MFLYYQVDFCRLPNDVVDYAVIPSFECYTFNYITSISCENSQCVLPELNTLYVPATQKNSINSVKYHEETVNDTYLEGDSVQKCKNVKYFLKIRHSFLFG
jgi:hypothetical protein